MPTKQEQVQLSPEEIMTRYYMTPGRFYPAEDSLAEKRGYGLASGISSAPAPAQSRGWDFGRSDVQIADDTSAIDTSKPITESPVKNYSAIDTSKPVKETPVDKLEGNMKKGSYQGSGSPEGYNLREGGMDLGYRMSDQVMPIEAQMQGLQLASAGATSAEVAEGKDIVLDEKKAADTVDQANKNPESLSPAQKLAMIAMAIAPAIAGYALHGENGAYIGGIAGMKGVHETAVTIENQRSQKRAQDSKERIAAGKLKAKEGNTSKPTFKQDAAGELHQVGADAQGKATFTPTGFMGMVPVGADIVGNLIVKTPAGVGATTAKTSTATKQKAPTGMPDSLPTGTKTNTILSIGKRIQDLNAKLGVPGDMDPFFDEYGHLTESDVSKPIPGQTPSQTKARIEKWEFLNKKLQAVESKAIAAVQGGLTRESQSEIKKELIGLTSALREASGLKLIAARGDEARKTVGYKADIAKINGAKNIKQVQDDIRNSQYTKQTPETYQKLKSIESLKNLKSGPALAGIFNSYMKLVQQDESVIRDADVNLVAGFMPIYQAWKDKGIRVFDEPGMTEKTRVQIIEASQALAEARVLGQIRMNSETYKKVRELGGDIRVAVPATVESVVNDFVRTTPLVTNKGAMNLIPENKIFRIKNQPGKVFIRSKSSADPISYEVP